MPVAVARVLHYSDAASLLSMGLIRNLFWFSLFLVSAFGFTVLFEHGTDNYFDNAKKEYDYLSQMAGMQPAKKADESEKIYK